MGGAAPSATLAGGCQRVKETQEESLMKTTHGYPCVAVLWIYPLNS